MALSRVVYNATMLSKDLVKALKKNTDFQEFLEYIVGVIEKMDSLDGFDTKLDDEKLGQQLRANIVAQNVLFKILEPLVDLSERKEPTKEQLDKVKERYGL